MAGTLSLRVLLSAYFPLLDERLQAAWQDLQSPRIKGIFTTEKTFDLKRPENKDNNELAS